MLGAYVCYFAAYAVNALGISSVTQLVSTYEMNGTSMFRSGFKLGNGYATYFPTSVPLTAKRKPLKNGTLVFAVTLVSTTTPVTVQYSGILSNPPKWVSSVPPVPPSPPSSPPSPSPYKSSSTLNMGVFSTATATLFAIFATLIMAIL